MHKGLMRQGVDVLADDDVEGPLEQALKRSLCLSNYAVQQTQDLQL